MFTCSDFDSCIKKDHDDFLEAAISIGARWADQSETSTLARFFIGIMPPLLHLVVAIFIYAVVSHGKMLLMIVVVFNYSFEIYAMLTLRKKTQLSYVLCDGICDNAEIDNILIFSRIVFILLRILIYLYHKYFMKQEKNS